MITINNKSFRNKEDFIRKANEPYNIDLEDILAMYQVGYEFVIADGKLVDIL